MLNFYKALLAAWRAGLPEFGTTSSRESPLYHGPLSFEDALEALARELGNPATPLIDYQSRRQALQTWCIDKGTWTSLTARLPPAPGPQQPDLGDRKRQLASIYAWVQVTSGEHLFAPRPIEAIMPPSLRKPWTQWTSAWKLLDPGHPDLTTPA